MPHCTLIPTAFVASAVLVAGTARADEFTSVSIAQYVNANLQAGNSAYPTGSPVILAGVPFDIPAEVNNYIETSSIGGTVVLTFPIGLSNVAGVHTLINTYWGQGGPGALASLTFDFDDGSTLVKSLVGNVDIRDFYQNVFTNVINGTTTVNAVTTDNDGAAGTNLYRLDKQFVDLSAFGDRTLLSMTLTDWGSNGVQRTFLVGITVQTVGIPCIPADINCDGTVNGVDLAIVLGAWGTPGADLNGDGTTDGVDLAIILGAWS